MLVLGFDVFGTLIDPRGIADALRPHAGARTDELVGLWRTRQIEYAFRRAAMERYVGFDRVTRAALDAALTELVIDVAEDAREALVAGWTELPAFPESAAALDALRGAGHRCLAFSNGTPAGLERLLAHSGLDGYLDGVVSVDEVGTFKPAPAVYHHFLQRGGAPADTTWLVSGNAWDVIGARAAGLHAAWVRRSANAHFDPWDESPDVVVGDLSELLRVRPFAAGDAA